MIKPCRIKRGDKVAVVSLSNGSLGKPEFAHKFQIAKQRLKDLFGVELVATKNALKDPDFVYAHPELRAQDLMDAFKDKSIKAIFSATGGEDSIRILPYVDLDVIRQNPKIFTGYSDTTVTHFIMQKAGVMSYYGASLMGEIAEYVKINDYTFEAVDKMLVHPTERFEIKNAGVESFAKDIVWWGENNINVARKTYPDTKGYEVLQGSGKVRGRLIGGCMDVFVMLMPTKVWPSLAEFKNKILCLEPCDIGEDYFTYILRALAAQGVFKQIRAIMFGKPQHEQMYEKYKELLKKVIAEEEGLKDLPIIYNVNFGHAYPITLLPLGAMCEIDLDGKQITLIEPATK